MRIIILSILYFISLRGLIAQPPDDSIYMLKAVEITTDKLLFTNDIDLQHYDAIKLENYSSQSLDNILNDYAGINIKTYGYGGMSNVGIRGGNSNHTAILWNGVNLQDPLNGGFNLSLFPVFFANNISVYKGGASGLFGSGAVGGSIHLSNKLDFNKGFDVDILSSIASFSNYQFGTGIKYSNNKTSSLFKIFYKTAINNFPFKNTQLYGSPMVKQENAEQQQLGILQENIFILNKHQKFNTAFWYQHNKQNIPMQMNSYSADANQENTSIRGQLGWKYFSNNYNINIKNSLLHSTLLYTDNISNIVALHSSISNITEADFHIKIREIDDLQIGLINTFEKAYSDDLKTQLDGNPHQNRTAFYLAYKAIFWKNILATANIRKEYLTDRFTPFTYSSNVKIRLFKTLDMNINISKNYRTPTFNDLFWSDAMARGNPNLKDESSINGEFGLLWKNKLKSFSLGANAYNTNYSNLIQWVPKNGIWTPINKKYVWARGIETTISIIKKKGYFSYRINGLLSLSRSTVEKINDNESHILLHKQLIMTPQIEGNINTQLAYKSISFEYILKHYGLRYTASDNSDYLDSYTLSDIIIKKNFSLKTHRLALMFRLNNIFNEVYVSMPSYAMPLCNYELSLRMYLNSK